MGGHFYSEYLQKILQWYFIAHYHHKNAQNEIRKNKTRRPPGVKSDPRGGKSQFLEKRLSPTTQNHYADLEDTCRDKVTKVGVIVRYTKKVIEKKTKAGVIFDPGWPFEG